MLTPSIPCPTLEVWLTPGVPATTLWTSATPVKGVSWHRRSHHCGRWGPVPSKFWATGHSPQKGPIRQAPLSCFLLFANNFYIGKVQVYCLLLVAGPHVSAVIHLNGAVLCFLPGAWALSSIETLSTGTGPPAERHDMSLSTFPVFRCWLEQGPLLRP